MQLEITEFGTVKDCALPAGTVRSWPVAEAAFTTFRGKCP